MDDFDVARDLYRDGKSLLDATRDQSVVIDRLRWAREDLDEVLLDLKLAVIEQNEEPLDRLMDEAEDLISIIFNIVRRADEQSNEHDGEAPL